VIVTDRSVFVCNWDAVFFLTTFFKQYQETLHSSTSQTARHEEVRTDVVSECAYLTSLPTDSTIVRRWQCESKCGAMAEWHWQGETELLQVTVPLCATQFSYRPVWDWRRASSVRGRHVTALATARRTNRRSHGTAQQPPESRHGAPTAGATARRNNRLSHGTAH